MPTRVATSSNEIPLVDVNIAVLSRDEVLKPADDTRDECRLRHHTDESRRVSAIQALLHLQVRIVVRDRLADVLVEPLFGIFVDAIEDELPTLRLVPKGQDANARHSPQAC
jgi:hypothetical protein